MKKGHSKNRHFSKGNNSRKRLINRKRCKNKVAKSANVPLAEKNFKLSCIGIAIQLADFLIDNIPRFFNWLSYLLGMD